MEVRRRVRRAGEILLTSFFVGINSLPLFFLIDDGVTPNVFEKREQLR